MGMLTPKGSPGIIQPFLLKVRHDGSIDRSFGQNGWLIRTQSHGLQSDSRSGALVLAHDKLIWATYNMAPGTGCDVFCFNKDGTYCSEFGDKGRLHFFFDLQHRHAITGVQVTEDGHIIIGGVHWDIKSQINTDNQFMVKVLLKK
jgi:hypothetical protein